jgi:hypothetical protein
MTSKNVIVPRVATPDMTEAAYHYHGTSNVEAWPGKILLQKYYQAMLSAAPQLSEAEMVDLAYDAIDSVTFDDGGINPLSAAKAVLRALGLIGGGDE